MIFKVILFIIALIFVIKLFINKKATSKPSSSRRIIKNTGEDGELRVKKLIGGTVDGEQYVLNNYMLVFEGKSSQIDHIVIKKNGLFVIETKDYAGFIYGKENQQQWTQVLAYGKVKNKFYNPVKQNATHIYQLKKILNENIEYKSIIVFVQNNTEHIVASNVVPFFMLSGKLNARSDKLLTDEQMKRVYNKLVEAKSKHNTSNQEHIEGINQMIDNIKKGICPRCSGKLVERKGHHGMFLGCTNYPKCKFTKKL